MRVLNRHKPTHFGIDYKYAPTTMKWCGSDTEELYYRNCKDDQYKNSLNYYEENPIEYSCNNYGFRTPDNFPDTKKIEPEHIVLNTDSEDVRRWKETQVYGNVFLGCSFTFGIGLHLEDTWSYKVNKEIGGKFWNLSLPGCGMDESFRYLYEFKDYLKIKNIFHLAPSFQKTRYEFIVDGKPLRLNLADEGKLEKHYSDILIDDKYQLLHFQKNYNAIRGLSQDLNCNYYFLSDEIGYNNDTKNSIIARDIIHPPPRYHNKIYKEFIELIKGR